MSLQTRLGDFTATAIGFMITSPNDTFARIGSNLLEVATPHVSQPVIDEIVRGLAGLALAVLSRWVYGLFEKRKKVEIVAPVGVPVPDHVQVEVKTPDPVTIVEPQNKNTDGNEKTKIGK